jgi:uncharacterized RDD family membrane protein YckC
MNSDNPYAPPAAASFEPPLIAQTYLPDPASQGKRFANLIVDRIVTYLLSYASGFCLGAMYAVSRSNPRAPIQPDELTMLNVLDFVQGLIVALSYYFIMEALCQRRIGKFVTGTRVVSANGGRPSSSQLLGRTFARLIPFEAFSFLSNNPVGWHDSLSGTRVVQVR